MAALLLAALMAAACGTEPSNVAIDNDPFSADATDDLAEPGDQGPEANGAHQDPSQSVTQDRPETSQNGGQTDGGDSTVEKVVVLPHIGPEPTGAGGTAQVIGTLRADPDMDDGCMWLERDDGVDQGLVWMPEHYDNQVSYDYYRARFYNDGSPAELITPDEIVLAREGDRVDLGGGGWAKDRIDLQDPPCQFDDDDVVATVYHPDLP